MQCNQCRVDYPQDLVKPLEIVTPQGSSKQTVCAICALENLKKVHKMPDYKFKPGSAAQQMYEKCQEFKLKKLRESMGI